jgi:hypothetical protein
MALVNAGGAYDRPITPVIVDVIPYDPAYGVASWWDEETVLRVEVAEKPAPRTAVISANPAGLRPLARHLLTLAQDEVPPGRHLDFDNYCGWLEEDSANLRIEVAKKGLPF